MSEEIHSKSEYRRLAVQAPEKVYAHIESLQAKVAALEAERDDYKALYEAKVSNVPLGPVVGAMTLVKLEAERDTLQREVDEGVLAVSGAKGKGWPVATLVEEAQHWKREMERLRTALVVIADRAHAGEVAGGEDAERACTEIDVWACQALAPDAGKE